MKGGRPPAGLPLRFVGFACLALVAALVCMPPAAGQTPSSYIQHGGKTALDNTGDLRIGWEWKGTFGVNERDTYAYTCPPAGSCTFAPAARGADAPSRHGVTQTGIRFRPTDTDNNTDVLNPGRTGGWGLLWRKGAEVVHGCFLDESLDCDGRPANTARINTYDSYHFYEHSQHNGPEDQPETYPAELRWYWSLLQRANGDFAADFEHWVQPLDQAGMGAGPRLTRPTGEPLVYEVREAFQGEGLDSPGAGELVYRRTFLPAIPTDNSLFGVPGQWDAGTKVGFGMAAPNPPPALRYSSTNGFALPDPFEPPASQWSGAAPGCATRLGPGSVSQGTTFTRDSRCFEGMLVELDLLQLPTTTASGARGVKWTDDANVILDWHVAVVPHPDEVLPLLNRIGAHIWFTAEGPPGDDGRDPLTFVWAIPNLYPPVPPVPDIAFQSSEPAEAPSGWSLATPCLGEPVTYQATTTQVFPAALKSNQWTVDGAAQGVNDPRADLTWTFTTTGPHTLHLTETNDKGLVGTKDVVVTVLDCTPPPLAPTAKLDAPTVTLDDCAPATFRFTGMVDAVKGRPDQDFVKWSLTFGDGASTGLLDWPPPAFVLHDYLQPGTFVATVLVKDSKGMTDTEIQYVQVCANRAPTVAGPTKVLTQSGTVVTLPIELGDRDWGAQVTLRLTGLPGTPSIGPIPMPYQGSFTLSGLLPGVYPVVAEATDETGAATQWHFPIIVSKRPNPAPDFDHDGVSDSADLCGGQGGAKLDGCQSEGPPVVVSMTIAPPDKDQDGVPDAADNCATTPNPRQDDLDQDLLGDACDEDDDGDGISEAGSTVDNCPGLANPDQADQDHDGTGDACRAPVFPRSATATPATWPHARGRDTWTPTTATTFAVGIAAVLAGLAWLNRHRLVWLATFSRLAKDKLLENRVRSQLVELIQAEPGAHLLALCKRTGRARGTIEHHVRRLVQEGFVREVVTPGFKRYWPAQHTGAPEVDAPMTASARAVATAIQESPGCSIQEAARATGLTHRAASYHVEHLARRGLVDRQRNGRAVQLFPRGGVDGS